MADNENVMDPEAAEIFDSPGVVEAAGKLLLSLSYRGAFDAICVLLDDCDSYDFATLLSAKVQQTIKHL